MHSFIPSQGGRIVPTLNRTTAIGREFTTSDRIPYTAHVAPTVVRTVFGDYLQVTAGWRQFREQR